MKKMSKVSEFHSGKGHDTALKWLSNGNLEMESACEDIYFKGDGVEKKYAVILHADSKSSEPSEIARIISINLKPHEVEKP